jgi:hypothetical protein
VAGVRPIKALRQCQLEVPQAWAYTRSRHSSTLATPGHIHELSWVVQWREALKLSSNGYECKHLAAADSIAAPEPASTVPRLRQSPAHEVVYELSVGDFTSHASAGAAASTEGTFAGVLSHVDHILVGRYRQTVSHSVLKAPMLSALLSYNLTNCFQSCFQSCFRMQLAPLRYVDRRYHRVAISRGGQQPTESRRRVGKRTYQPLRARPGRV